MGKGIVKLGEGNWAVKDGNLLAAKETNGRFKNAEFTVARGTDATYVGRDGLIKRFSSGLANEVANGSFDELSDELVTNGDFSSGSTGWSTETGWTISDGKATQDGSAAGVGSTGDLASSGPIFEIGETYQIQVDVVDYESGDIDVTSSNISLSVTEDGTYYAYYTATTTYLHIRAGYSDFKGSIDNVSVKQVNVDSEGNDIWTLPSGWSISNNQLVGNDPSGFATVANVFYANKSYRLDVDVAERDSGSFSIISNSTDSNSNATPAIDSAGIHTFYFHIGTIDLETLYVTFGGDFVGKINSITVRDIEDFDDRPRIDFTDNTDGHLLLEPQSTNLVTYSEDFSEWTANNMANVNTQRVLADGITSPDGSVGTSYKLTASQVSSRIQLGSITSSSTYTKSIFVKYAGADTTVRLDGSDTNDRIQFDVTSSGVVLNLANSNVISHDIVAYNNDWFRISVTLPSGSDSFQVLPDSANGNSYAYFWGAQFEELSYATSYIPTNGSTVTRDAETCTGAGEAADFNSEEGVLYAEIAAFEAQPDFFISMNDGTQNNRVIIKFSEATDNELTAFTINSTDSSSITHTISDFKQYNKIALSYNSSYLKLFVNGQEVGTSVASPNLAVGLNVLNLSNLLTDKNVKGKVKALRVYKETDGIDLATLTS